MEKIIESNKEQDTYDLGYELGQHAKPGQVFTLVGDLGVGKTVFTKGLAAGLGITEPVSSPTFTIVQVYDEGRLPFYHFDVYRIGDVEEMDEIGYEDYVYGEGVSLIEDKYMRILALDSSGLVASVAVVEKIEEEEQVIAEYTVNYKKTHSQTLLPMLDTVSDMIELDLKTIDAIAVAGGPGSFTGLRIGSATAKGLGLAMNKPLIHIPTLEGLAYNLCGTDAIVCPIMDARRGQVYTGIYEFCGNELVVLEDQMAISIEELGDHLKKYDKRIIFLGDGVPVFRARLTDEILAEEIKAGRDIQFAPANMNRQRAASVGTLGLRYYAAGKTETAMEHEPDYLRLSQAERERKEREAKSIQ